MTMYTLRNKFGKYLSTGTNCCSSDKPESFFDTFGEALAVYRNPPLLVYAEERVIIEYSESVAEIPKPRIINITLQFDDNVHKHDLAECVLDAVEKARQDKTTTTLDIVVR